MLNFLAYLFLVIPSIVCQSSNITNRVGETVYDVVIVGAGLTGLTAARNIQKVRPELSVLVLEARGQVGGRIRYATMTTKNGVEFVDIGSQFIAHTDYELLSVIREVGIEVGQQLACGTNTVFQQRRKRNVGNDEQVWKETPFSELVNADNLLNNLTGVSIAQITNGMEATNADSVNRLLQTFFDAPADQVSAVQLALTCSSENATSVEILRRFGHGQSFLANGGMNEVVRRLADGTLIEYDQRVISVNDAISPAIVTTSNGKAFNARQVILTVPIPTLSNIQLIPQPENLFQQLVENYGPAGHAYYFTMTFQRGTWRLNGKSGKVIYTSQNGPLVWLTTFDTTFASSCENSTQSSSTIWGIAHFSYEVPFETRKRLYIQAIMYSLRFADFSPLDVADVSFANDELARGTIPSLRINVPVESLKYLNDYHTLYQNVHISTADIASTSLGTMNGAIHAAKAVSDRVLELLGETDQQMNGILRDTPIESSTPFVYHTSSHYPPGIFQTIETTSSSPERPLQRDDASSYSSTFKYETSSQYPSTVAPTTTTMKHFSFGNLEAEDTSTNETAEIIPIQYDGVQPSDMENENTNDTSFIYHTSSVMPTVQPIETTSFIHFSNGNAGGETVIQRDSVNVESAPVSESNGEFIYSTTPHYSTLSSDNSGYEKIEKATPSSQVISELEDISELASNSTSIQLASRLTSLVQTILTGLRLR